jgi:hypothetical protein
VGRPRDGELTWHVGPALLASAGGWAVDVVGIGQWRRQVLDGAEPLAVTPAERPADRG